MKKQKIKIARLTVLLLVASCKTYTIPIDSFRAQMKQAKPDNVKETVINNPLLYGDITYRSNHIKSLTVIDKKGNKHILKNSPSLEMRVTHKNGKKYHFYFDTVVLENDTLVGNYSRFVTNISRKIPIDSIVKIEVQDSGKNIRYQKLK